MKTFCKGVLKARMFEIFRDLEMKVGELIVTDHGKPVLKITRYAKGPTIDVIFAELRKKQERHRWLDNRQKTIEPRSSTRSFRIDFKDDRFSS